ncbi:prefoldin subunit 6 [Talpa occidentalis]|nr:prefoldin subunit 6 [Talpa occidentalis]
MSQATTSGAVFSQHSLFTSGFSILRGERQARDETSGPFQSEIQPPLSHSPQTFVPAMAELIQKKLQGEVEKYQQLQKDLSKSMSGRQKLEAQLTENNIVKEELALLDGSNVVFKLLGPVLVKQELGEARATVGKRLDYITAEIKRYESQLRDLERQSEQQRETLAQLQQEFQRAQAAKAGASGKA